MTDQEWNLQEGATADAIRDHSQEVEESRRKIANAYARANGLVDDQEDLINQYRGQGLQQMRAVEGYVGGNKKDWEEAKKAIDDIADSQSAGFADRFLEKLFGGYTLPTALWKDKVRGEPDVDHNKRKTVIATGGFLAGGALTGSAADYLNGDGAAAGSSGGQVVESTISDSSRIGSYLEDEVQGDELLSAQRNWGDLLNQYDFEEGEFFPDSDRTLEGIDIIHNGSPGEHSEYGVTMGIGNETEYDTRTLKDDKAAESALEYFEVNK